jgi:CRP/FNR family cyclic AMP-dependent transcriptional regulator
MIDVNLQTNRFKVRMRDSFEREALYTPAIKIAKDDNVYAPGDEIDTVYLIESGRVKLAKMLPGDRECTLAIHGSGDIFGELCLSGLACRMETATATEDTSLKRVSRARFLIRLGKDSLLEGFVRYLAVRIADQQQVIASLVIVDSQRSLGKTLLRLSERRASQAYARA